MSLESDSSSFASSSIDSDKNSSTGYSFYTPLFMIYTSFSTTNYLFFYFFLNAGFVLLKDLKLYKILLRWNFKKFRIIFGVEGIRFFYIWKR
jgi:hypothetical protein